MTLLGGNVVVAHALPTTPARMAVKKRKARASGGSFGQRALEVSRLETGVAVDVAFALSREDKPLNQGGKPFATSAGIPKREAEVLLAVAPNQMCLGLFINRSR